MSVIWDNHACISLKPGKTDFYTELEQHRLAGFSVVGINIGYADTPWQNQIDLARRLSDWLSENDDKFYQIRKASDVQSATSKKLGVFFDVEGANLLEENIDRIPVLYDLGVRWMCLTYNTTNAYVGGCLPDAVDHGLTNLGKSAIDKMQDVGMIVCCSHTGHKSALEIIEYSEKPVIFSHSNSKEVFGHWRNISDSLAIKCAEKNGVICVNGVGPFLGSGKADTSKLIKHAAHFIDLVGPEHVGLGLDFVYDMAELENDLKENQDLFADDLSAIENFTFVAPNHLNALENDLKVMGLSQSGVASI